ncbi:MAG TPA: bifunctional phosphoglucose/phosphomannose isomerase [Anaerolineales bacterium]|nr:bifunctional phosphoglucose/phosphomannose isomerase [Anaerolineales bacterium]
MNLDDLSKFQQIDSSNMLAHVDGLPDQIEAAWALGQKQPLPDLGGVTQVLLCGMGGSAIGGSLLSALIASECRLSFVVSRDYDLPAWAHGQHTLVIGSSHSGGTEETLSAFKQAIERKTKLIAITTGGPIAELCRGAGGTVWEFAYKSQPRAAVGYSFALPLALFCRAEWISDQSANVAGALTALREQQKSLRAESPVVHNPAKRMAGQLMDRYVLIFGSGMMGAVARRWKGQVNENAKAWAQYEELPEMNHNSVVGTEYPEALINKYMVVFLESDFDHPRNKIRSTVTRELFMTAGFNTDVIRGVGPSPLTQMLTSLHYGDYVSYYLAMAYGVDPTPIGPINVLKESLARA